MSENWVVYELPDGTTVMDEALSRVLKPTTVAFFRYEQVPDLDTAMRKIRGDGADSAIVDLTPAT